MNQDTPLDQVNPLYYDHLKSPQKQDSTPTQVKLGDYTKSLGVVRKEKNMENKTIVRAALGEVAMIGDLYDARTDTFCGVSILKEGVPASLLKIRITDFSTTTQMHYAETHKLSERLTKLDLNSALQVSILTGLVPAHGVAQWLDVQGSSTANTKHALIWNINTKNEFIDLPHEVLEENIVFDDDKTGTATHVVAGISWGAKGIISCDVDNWDNSENSNLVADILQKAIRKIKFTDNDKKFMEKMTLTFYGDIFPETFSQQNSFKMALEQLNKMPQLVGNCNSGKGKPLTYHLEPIPLRQNYHEFPMNMHYNIQTSGAATHANLVEFFDEFSSAHQIFFKFYAEALQYRCCVQPKDFVELFSMNEQLLKHIQSVQTKLSMALAKIRSGLKESSLLNELITEFKQNKFSAKWITSWMKGWNELALKIGYSRILIKNKVTYVGLYESPPEVPYKNKTYILYFTQKGVSEDPTWSGNFQIFLRELKNSGKNCFTVVDCDFHPKLMPQSKSTCIEIWQFDRKENSDLFAAEQKFSSIAWVERKTTRPVAHPPNKRAPFVVPCAGIYCNPTQRYIWHCRKCEGALDYGYDSHIYCKCGRTHICHLKFKCTDQKHGHQFERQNNEHLLQIVNQLRPFTEMNILILGETGVGKSTWINGFINFLNYDNLQKAEEGGLITIIPSEFTVCDENFEQKVIRTGQETKNVLQVGQSVTQETKVYPFPIGNTTVRLIDTPGIGDTRGIEQDKKNFQNILGTLSFLEEIHGICVLLKPNNARLNVMFRFCIKELLTYLHRDASKNILFCFTNSRGTFYRPGDTMPALMSLLKENKQVEIVVSPKTVYCFDSEAYRFLAAITNNPPVFFDEGERQNFANSWDKSILETKRMLEHIKSLKPHPIKNTLNLNHARELVLSLTRPLAEITRTIEINKVNLQDEMSDIGKTEATLEELRKKQTTTVTRLETKQLDYPKTVCAHNDCINVVTAGNIKTIEYKQTCHEHCGVGGVAQDLYGHPKLIKCRALKKTLGFSCNACGHSYRNHLHVFYESILVSMQVEDEAVKEALNQGLNAADVQQKMVEDKMNKIKMYENEQEEIEKASVKFACFLKNNAITPYNDDMENYLMHLIREEEDKGLGGGNSTTLKGLKENLASYTLKKGILETAMENETETLLNISEVELLVDKLKRLPLTGSSLQEALTCLNATKQVVYHETIVTSGTLDGVKNKPKSKISKIVNTANWAREWTNLFL